MSQSPNRATRLKAASAGLAVAALAATGLALSSTSTEAATPTASPLKPGYAGAPVNPAPYSVTQPDGSTLRVHRFGDALSNGVATVAGDYTVVKGNDGYWRYASGLNASGKVKASSVVAGQGAAPKAAKGLAPAATRRETPNLTPKAGTGNDTELVILVSFADQDPVGSTQDDWSAKYFTGPGSVNAFYDEASKGQYGLNPAEETSGTVDNGVVGWIELPYDHPDTGVTNGPDDYVKDAIVAAGDYVDYASYDANDDGQITTDELHITVIGAGYETSYSGPGNTCEDGPSIWGHQWDFASGGIVAPVIGGVTVGDNGYTTFGEWHCAADEAADPDGHMATIGIMAHEFGHDINWPDLYDIDGSSEGIGEFSLMSGGSWGQSPEPGSLAGDSPAHPDAWALWYQDWVTPTTISTTTKNIQVPAGESVLMSPNPNGVDWLFGEHSGTGEYFLAENREPVGFDASIPGCGLVVYRIDETVTSSNGANRDETDPLVKVMEADGLDEMATNVNRGDEGDPFPGSTKNRDFNDTTTPNANFDWGLFSGLNLHLDSKKCADTMQIDVTPGIASPPPPRPANDDYATATVISGTTGTLSQTTKHATVEPGESPDPLDGAASVWFKWTAPASGDLTVDTIGSGFDTVLALYTGSALPLTLIDENDDAPNGGGGPSSVTIPVTAGTTYSIAGMGWAGDTGALTLNWELEADPVTPTVTPTVAPTVTPTVTPTTPTTTPTPIVAPANDAFAHGMKLKGKTGSTKGTTVGATAQSAEKVFTAGKGGKSSVWFTWTAKKDGTVVVKSTGTFKPLLAVVKGTKLAKLKVLGSDTTGLKGKVTVDVKAGKTYRIVLDGKRGASGAYTLSWKWKA